MATHAHMVPKRTYNIDAPAHTHLCTQGGMYHGVAFADHWRGPYRKLTPHKPIPLETDCEDPYLFRDPVRSLPICLLGPSWM